MNKISMQNKVSLQKCRSKIALCIRLGLFLSVTIFYLIYHLNSPKNSKEQTHGRKLLSIATPAQFTAKNQSAPTTEIENLSSKENSNILPEFLQYSEHHNDIWQSNFWDDENCIPPAIEEFPSDGFTRFERKQGWIVIHVILACYCFWLLAAICDDYFVPAIDLMCNSFQMNEDVIGATFMAAATSSPELFINCIGTFVTKGDIGVGTIVGSAVFNILAVPACCGLLAGQFVVLDWWPVTRDCLMYCIAVFGLIGTLYDGKVMWYEALLLVIAYFIYMFAMYCNDVMARKARKLITKFRSKKSKNRPFKEVTEVTPLLTRGLTAKSEKLFRMESIIEIDKNASLETLDSELSDSSEDYADDPWTRGNGNRLIFILRWPITFLLWITIPDCRKRLKLKYLTFIMAVIWIGVVSYFVAYFITFIGDTLNIPDSVMGLTILAAGMSIPEAVSSVIVTNQGHGGMGISNSIGSNTFDILLCLGLPWLIKAYFLPDVPGEFWLTLNSSGLTYSAISLLTTLFGLYVAFLANKFHLDWKIGIACSIMYVGFLLLASMIELNLFFKVNLPICDH